jgi:hypothetical protein
MFLKETKEIETNFKKEKKRKKKPSRKRNFQIS